ncbi:hypothetical protein E2542_SST12549 [Spatholobus suberectus]|nr:hypothetical protein E2542_SST12549 [Spatholobus suberectus]
MSISSHTKMLICNFQKSLLTWTRTIKPCGSIRKGQKFPFPIRNNDAESKLCNQHIVLSRVNLIKAWTRLEFRKRIKRFCGTKSFEIPHEEASRNNHSNFLDPPRRFFDTTAPGYFMLGIREGKTSKKALLMGP